MIAPHFLLLLQTSYLSCNSYIISSSVRLCSRITSKFANWLRMSSFLRFRLPWYNYPLQSKQKKLFQLSAVIGLLCSLKLKYKLMKVLINSKNNNGSTIKLLICFSQANYKYHRILALNESGSRVHSISSTTFNGEMRRIEEIVTR